MNHSKTKTLQGIFGVLFLACLFMSYSGNPPNGNTGAPGESSCNSCHGGSNPQGLDGTVQIGGLPATVTAGTTYPLSVTVSNPNGLSQRAGFQMVALTSSNDNAGSMSNAGSSSSIVTGNRTYHEHSPAIPYDGNRNATWTVDWTAPEDAAPNEMITFYAVGNIADMNDGGNTSNDLIVFNTSTTTLEGGTPQAADLTISNLTNFPASAKQGEAAFYNFNVNNQGNVPVTGEYDILMFLSTDQTFSTDDVEAGVVPTGNTPIGTISDVPGGITVPEDFDLGNYYLLIVIDANNDIEELDENNNVLASNTTLEVLPSSNPISVSTNSQDVTCNGFSDGSASVNVMGGVSPYSYMWSNGATTATINNVTAGTYTVTITDNNGTTSTASATINQPAPLNAAISSQINNACTDQSAGSLTISPSGGTAPYNYAWSNGNTGTTISNLPTGSYTVIITDANGCTIQMSATISAEDNTAPTITCPDNITTNRCDAVEYEKPSVVDNCSEMVSLNLTNGLASGSIFPAGLNTINYEAVDAAGNMATCSFTITVDPDLAINIDGSTDAIENDGMITVTVSGGTPPYSYDWQLEGVTVSTEEDPTNLGEGTYILTVNDAGGCSVVSEEVVINMVLDINDPVLAQAIQVFPNPTSGQLQVQFSLENTSEVAFEVLDILGQVVRRFPSSIIRNNSYTIDLEGLAEGSYLIKMTIGEDVVIKQILLK